MKPALPASTTELEERLRSPHGADEQQAYQVRLQALATRVQTQLKRGAGPNDYAIGRALENAIKTASEVLAEQSTIPEPDTTGLPTPIAATNTPQGVNS